MNAKTTHYELYYNIINNRLANPLNSNVMGEYHHIKPLSIYPNLKNDKSNIVKLTIKEHILVHYHLWKYYKDELQCILYADKMCDAFWLMLHTKYDAAFGELTLKQLDEIGNIYEDILLHKRISTSRHMKKYWSNSNNRKLQSIKLKKICSTDLHKLKLSNGLYNRYKNQFERIKTSNALKQIYIDHPENREIVSKRLKEFYSNPLNKEKVSRGVEQSWKNKEVRLKRVDALNAAYKNPEYRKNKKLASTRYWSNEENHIKCSNILKAANKEHPEYVLKRSTSRCRKILLYTLDMIFIKEWKSLKDLCETLHYGAEIIDCVHHRILSAHGFIWIRPDLEIKNKQNKKGANDIEYNTI